MTFRLFVMIIIVIMMMIVVMIIMIMFIIMNTMIIMMIMIVIIFHTSSIDTNMFIYTYKYVYIQSQHGKICSPYISSEFNQCNLILYIYSCISSISKYTQHPFIDKDSWINNIQNFTINGKVCECSYCFYPNRYLRYTGQPD